MDKPTTDDRLQALIDELRASRITSDEFASRLRELMQEASAEKVAEIKAPETVTSEALHDVDVEQVKKAAREARSL